MAKCGFALRWVKTVHVSVQKCKYRDNEAKRGGRRNDCNARNAAFHDGRHSILLAAGWISPVGHHQGTGEPSGSKGLPQFIKVRIPLAITRRCESLNKDHQVQLCEIFEFEIRHDRHIHE